MAKLRDKDTGPGIAPEEQKHIFDRFYRGDPARSRGGTGLGLALTRSIVLAHDGQISVNSILGKGSCFIVRLPLVPQDTPRTEQEDAEGEGQRVGGETVR